MSACINRHTRIVNEAFVCTVNVWGAKRTGTIHVQLLGGNSCYQDERFRAAGDQENNKGLNY